jgi:hypothetical protein
MAAGNAACGSRKEALEAISLSELSVSANDDSCLISVLILPFMLVATFLLRRCPRSTPGVDAGSGH